MQKCVFLEEACLEVTGHLLCSSQVELILFKAREAATVHGKQMGLLEDI